MIFFTACGENANCQARNNRAQCECPPDFLGDPNSRCYTECTRHDECSATQVYFKNIYFWKNNYLNFFFLRLALDLVVKIHAENPIQMSAVLEQIVK